MNTNLSLKFLKPSLITSLFALAAMSLYATTLYLQQNKSGSDAIIIGFGIIISFFCSALVFPGLAKLMLLLNAFSWGRFRFANFAFLAVATLVITTVLFSHLTAGQLEKTTFDFRTWASLFVFSLIFTMPLGEVWRYFTK